MINMPKCTNISCIARKYCQIAVYKDIPDYSVNYQNFQSTVINKKFFCLNKVIEPKDLTKINLKLKLGL